MTETIHLGLPFIEGSQAQKHVTHNEALRALDALVMLAVLDRDLAAPPVSPADGDRYIVKAPGAGGFAGKNNQIALCDGGVWTFHAPQPGWTCYVEDEAAFVVYDGSAWQIAAGSVLQNLTRLGVGTTADATNPLAAKLNNALFTARTVAEGGDGHLRYKLSKESVGKTLSLLFQDNYSGRAEFGLTGDDDFHLKVSPDGTSWIDALKIAAADGTLSFPARGTGLRQRLTAVRTYYVDASLGSDSNDGLAAGSGRAFATLQHALDVVFGTLDLGGNDVTIQLADGTYGPGRQASPQVGAGTVTLAGNAATPANVVVAATTAGQAGIDVSNGASLTLAGLTINSLWRCLSVLGGKAYFSNIRFGASGDYQMRASDLGYIQATGSYAIVGGGSSVGHWSAVGNGIVRMAGSLTVTIEAAHTFTDAFAQSLTGANLIGSGISFAGAGAGSITGKKYNIQSNSVLQLGGLTLPGSLAGTTATGGQVV